MNKPSPPVERWCAVAENLSWVSGELNNATFECFKTAVSEGIAKADACAFAEERIRAAGHRVRRGAFDRQWQGAIRWVAKHGSLTRDQSEYAPQVVIDYERVDSIVRAGPLLYDLWEESPVCFVDDYSHTEEVIDVVFPNNPWLCVGIGKYDFETERRETLRGRLAQKEFIVAQPMTSRFGRTIEGKRSAHSLSHTGPRSNYVIEFDFSEKDKKTGKDTIWAPWIRNWAGLKITVADACAALADHFSNFAPLGLIVHSAGKSCHAWFPAGGATHEQIEAFRREAFVLGADPVHFRNRSQFVRMPDGARSKTGQRQAVIFFDPEVFPHATDKTQKLAGSQ